MKYLFQFVLIPALELLPFSTTLSQIPDSAYAAVEGRKIYYESKGTGPAVLFIHGFAFDARMWDDQFDTFSTRFRIVRYDISGYGRSTVPDMLISSSDEIAALFKHLHIEKATVVGMSLGGRVASTFEIEYPEMVEALVTVSSTLDGFKFSDALRSRLANYPKIAKDSGLAMAKELWLADPYMTPVTNVQPVRRRVRQMSSEWSGAQFRNPAL